MPTHLSVYIYTGTQSLTTYQAPLEGRRLHLINISPSLITSITQRAAMLSPSLPCLTSCRMGHCHVRLTHPSPPFAPPIAVVLK